MTGKHNPIMKYKFLDKDKLCIPPVKSSKDAAGWDICAVEQVEIPTKGSVIIETNLAIAPLWKDDHFVVRGRSGMAFKHDILCFHGTVDSDYRGEVKVKLFNVGSKPYCVCAGDRIAQLVLLSNSTGNIEEADELPPTERNTDGFGSTGK